MFVPNVLNILMMLCLCLTNKDIAISGISRCLLLTWSLTLPSLWSLSLSAGLFLCSSLLSSGGPRSCCRTGLCPLLSCWTSTPSSSLLSTAAVCPPASSTLRLPSQSSSVNRSLSTPVWLRSCCRVLVDSFLWRWPGPLRSALGWVWLSRRTSLWCWR